MKFQKGMKRYAKSEGAYHEDAEGAFYKAGDGKMYKLTAKDKKKDADDADYPGGDDADKAKKSMTEITSDDLQKTLDEIEDLIKAEDPAERKNQLLLKAQEGDLTTEENEELLKALRGGDELADTDPTISEQLTKSFGENESLQKALDVSEYLDEQHSEMVKALSIVGDHIESEGRRQHDFNLVLAKAMHQVVSMSKSISERLGVIEAQPIRAPKSQGVRVPQGQATLEKSFGGADGSAPSGAGEQLSKDDMLDTMSDMMEKSNGTAECGEDILQAIAKFEQTGQMSKGMAANVIDFHRKNAH